MGYFTNYDPFTGAPFNRPVFYRKYPGEEELVSYYFNGRSYVIDSSVAKSEGIESQLPVSETRPYHWMCTEPIVLLFRDGTTKDYSRKDIGTIEYGEVRVKGKRYTVIGEYIDGAQHEVVPFFRSVWEIVSRYVRREGYTNVEVFQELSRRELEGEGVCTGQQDCGFTLDVGLKGDDPGIQYVSRGGSVYRNPRVNEKEKKRIEKRLREWFTSKRKVCRPMSRKRKRDCKREVGTRKCSS